MEINGFSRAIMPQAGEDDVCCLFSIYNSADPKPSIASGTLHYVILGFHGATEGRKDSDRTFSLGAAVFADDSKGIDGLKYVWTTSEP